MSDLTRRGFLQASGIAAGSLVLGCRSTADELWTHVDVNTDSNAVFDAWIAITPGDQILVQAHKVEMGQGTYTAFATLVGEELRTDPSRIELVAAPVDAAFGAPMQGTGGSSSLTDIWQPLRESGARAREMLSIAGAARLGVEAEDVEVVDGEIRDRKSGRSVTFGEVATAASQLRAPRRVTLTPPEQWRFIGKSGARVDAPDKVRGVARYGMDVSLPDMRTAVVVHCPHPQGSLASYSAAPSLAVDGVEDVFPIQGGIAIVAKNYWSARLAASKLEVAWDAGESKGVDSAAIRRGLSHALEEGDLHSARDDGNAGKTLAAAGRVIEAQYALPYLAHATMEPMNCTVAPRDGGCDVYVGSQAPSLIQDAVAAELDLDRDSVNVHNQLLGGGFGRRFFVDMAAEAAQIAKQVGHPVKLVWSREDDMARDYYRPASLHRLRASLGSDATPEAWEHRLAAPSLIPHMASIGGALAPQWMRGAFSSFVEGLAARIPNWAGPILAIEGAKEQPYSIPNVSVDAIAWDPGIPVGIWRSVGHSHNGFVVESFIDELAHAAGEDPAEYRRKLLAGHPRHLAVLDRLVDVTGWGASPETSRGMAVHESFNTVVGEVAEVSFDGDAMRVERVVCVVDCGLAVNPDIVKAQMESAINFGLTAALYGAIHFKDGAAIESNFHDHPMLRMADAPEIEVHILPSAEAPTGVGEPGTPPIAAAVANAIFAATGKRLRELPLGAA